MTLPPCCPSEDVGRYSGCPVYRFPQSFDAPAKDAQFKPPVISRNITRPVLSGLYFEHGSLRNVFFRPGDDLSSRRPEHISYIRLIPVPADSLHSTKSILDPAAHISGPAPEALAVDVQPRRGLGSPNSLYGLRSKQKMERRERERQRDRDRKRKRVLSTACREPKRRTNEPITPLNK